MAERGHDHRLPVGSGEGIIREQIPIGGVDQVGPQEMVDAKETPVVTKVTMAGGTAWLCPRTRRPVLVGPQQGNDSVQSHNPACWLRRAQEHQQLLNFVPLQTSEIGTE